MKSFLNLRVFPGASPVSYPVHFAAPRLRRLLSVTRFEHENSATRERPASPSYTQPLPQLWLDTAEDHTDTGQPTGSNPVQEEYRAAVQVVSQEQGRPEFEILQQFQLLQVLLPDLTARIGSMAAIDVVRLSVDIVDIAEKVLLIRDALPAANVSRIVAGSPGLLYLSKDELQSNLQQVESLLAPHEPRWQTMITEAPFLAQATQLQATLQQIERTFDTRHTGAKPATLLGIMITMGLGGPKWPSLDASSDESDLLWL